MARFSLFSVTIFLVLAAIALSLPTKRDATQGLTLENAFDGLKTATKSLEGLEGLGDNKQTNDQDNEAKKGTDAAAEHANANDSDTKRSEPKDEKEDKPTRTEKKPSSGNFVTPTATHTHHPTSQPNALGKIPILGGLLGGTGGPL